MEVRKPLVSGKKSFDQNDSEISEMGQGVTTGKSKDLLKRIIKLLKNFKW